MSMAKILGIDYGEKHVGLAVTEGFLAEPVKTVPTRTALTEIMSLIDRYQVTRIMVGLSEGAMAQKTREFGLKLAQMTGLTVVYQDETLTSYETRLKMAKAGKKKQKREEKIDHLVAATILQEYLDTHS